MIETEAALAERTKRFLKSEVNHHIEEYEYKYNQELIQFVTSLKSRRKCSIDLIPKIVTDSAFLSLPYGRPLQKLGEPKFRTGNRVRNSKYDFAFRKGNRPQYRKEVFETVAISSRKPSTYTKQNEQDQKFIGKILSNRFDESQLTLKAFTRELDSNESA